MDDTKIINVFHNDWDDVIIVSDTILYKKNNENIKFLHLCTFKTPIYVS